MFYQGDLQEGIGLAVREAKAVVCFVRDDTEESDTWENTYFDGEIPDLLQQHAVTLRLVAGSPEVGHLSSICPIIAYPTVMVIKNGLVQLYVFRGTTKGQFQTRLKATLTSSSQPSPAPATTQTSVQAAAQPSREPTQAPNTPATTTTATTPPSVSSPTPSTSSTTQQERTSSEDSQRRRESIRAGKRQVTSRTTTDSDRAAQEQKQLREEQLRLEREKRQQREERERIRSNIQKDQERRRLEAQEAARLASSSSTTTTSSSTPDKPRPSSDQYRLQVRLFDGQSVRRSFPPSATVSKDVRTWLDAQQSGTRPYKLKHILTPQPSRTLSVTDEECTLQELGLGPTASLVMVPVHTYSDAYSASSSSSTTSSALALVMGLPARIFSVAIGLIVTVLGLIGSMLGFGGNSSSPPPRRQRDAAPASGTSSSSSYAQNDGGGGGGRGNVRTLRDQRGDEQRDQLYNGNQLNFEPRRDNADEKDRKHE
ncbi:hypothetical protein VTN31DRAFT_7502 [Thermomyces dupontii]|uniref:uncharacterized protein n=1 Tax=Talaromyces thermophilus TaxID=28565 RepID=UPI0037437AE9